MQRSHLDDIPLNKVDRAETATKKSVVKGGGTSAVPDAQPNYTTLIDADQPQIPGESGATFNGQPVQPVRFQELYHGTNRETLGLGNMTHEQAAQSIYQNGLNARGTNIELTNHVAGLPDTAFRGTTTDKMSQGGDAGAVYWAGEDGLVIEFKGVKGYDVNQIRDTNSQGSIASMAQGAATRGEQEISIPALVRPQDISRVGRVIPNPRKKGGFMIDWIDR